MFINAQSHAVVDLHAIAPRHRILQPQGLLLNMTNSGLNILPKSQPADTSSAGAANDNWNTPTGLKHERYSNTYATTAYNNSYNAYSCENNIINLGAAAQNFETQLPFHKQENPYMGNLAFRPSSGFRVSESIEYWGQLPMASSGNDCETDYRHALTDCNSQSISDDFAPSPLPMGMQDSFSMDFDYQSSEALDYSSNNDQDSFGNETWFNDLKQGQRTTCHGLPSLSSDNEANDSFFAFDANRMHWNPDTAAFETISPNILTCSSSSISMSGSSESDADSLSDTASEQDELGFQSDGDKSQSDRSCMELGLPAQASSMRHKLPSKPDILPDNARSTQPAKTRTSTARQPKKPIVISSRDASTELFFLEPHFQPPKPTITTQKTLPSRSRGTRDEFLMASKLAGMTYREIRIAGGFKEAESTLRGRYRMLTKAKGERVRKPAWKDVDVKLLRKAVERYRWRGKVVAGRRGRIPWKKVAEYIKVNGGSYHFGNATCRKKWDELVAAEAED